MFEIIIPSEVPKTLSIHTPLRILSPLNMKDLISNYCDTVANNPELYRNSELSLVRFMEEYLPYQEDLCENLEDSTELSGLKYSVFDHIVNLEVGADATTEQIVNAHNFYAIYQNSKFPLSPYNRIFAREMRIGLLRKLLYTVHNSTVPLNALISIVEKRIELFQGDNLLIALNQFAKEHDILILAEDIEKHVNAALGSPGGLFR